ncbi:dihydrodipicolinate synthase family protein [Sphingomonas nostoxanthinifaciens]|uniref:dihydrodipicolinate synthase family protein n=1 Tax=Sphingomonas nostoxanthinifaciens TaxID=2872652 RepID=UPI001CC1CDA2|nr:dihydrodipicolinate synthase family protein [Sphingomonas nostoxanthinifaciens]UAK22921.1 dihydrodipicolinate synthase family protein [Sphingomonas nostoxanthinifaciens]
MSDKRARVGWRGYIPAIVTPFAADGALDLGGLGAMLEWLHAEGMHGLILAGTTGEWTSMSADERAALFSAAGAQLADKLPLIAGCSSFTARETIAFAVHAAAQGFEGILVTPPPYIRPNEDELFGFYTEVAAGSPLPVCIYNWPPGTAIDMPVALLERLAGIDNVVAIKQSTSDLRRFTETFFRLNDTVRIFGHSMDEHGLALLEARGGDGTMGAGGVLGRVQPDFYNHLWAGDIAAARACGRKDRAILEDWYTPELTGRFGSGPAVLKAALRLRGVPAGFVRAPLREVSPAYDAAIRETLARLDCL